jgi:hypothetical protein
MGLFKESLVIILFFFKNNEEHSKISHKSTATDLSGVI